MPMVVPFRPQEAEAAPGRPELPPEYLMMAAATMHEQGRLDISKGQVRIPGREEPGEFQKPGGLAPPSEELIERRTPGGGIRGELKRQELEAAPSRSKGKAIDWPTGQDVINARMSDLSYGSKDAPYMTTGKASLKQTPIETMPYQAERGGTFHGAALPVSRAQADRTTRQWLAAQRSPTALLGFDPRLMVESPKSETQLTVAGLYDPKTDVGWYDTKFESAAVHESMHRGINALRRAGKLPAAAERYEEYVVRGLVQRHFGDIEAPMGAESAKQVSDWRKYITDKLLDQVEAASAKLLEERHPRGPR